MKTRKKRCLQQPPSIRRQLQQQQTMTKKQTKKHKRQNRFTNYHQDNITNLVENSTNPQQNLVKQTVNIQERCFIGFCRVSHNVFRPHTEERDENNDYCSK